VRATRCGRDDCGAHAVASGPLWEAGQAGPRRPEDLAGDARRDDWRDAFARHLYDNGPVDVAHRTLPIADALAAGRAANAAMALAHPHLYAELEAAMVRRASPGLE